MLLLAISIISHIRQFVPSSITHTYTHTHTHTYTHTHTHTHTHTNTHTHIIVSLLSQKLLIFKEVVKETMKAYFCYRHTLLLTPTLRSLIYLFYLLMDTQSKLPSRSGFVDLRQLNPIDKKRQ